MVVSTTLSLDETAQRTLRHNLLLDLEPLLRNDRMHLLDPLFSTPQGWSKTHLDTEQRGNRLMIRQRDLRMTGVAQRPRRPLVHREPQNPIGPRRRSLLLAVPALVSCISRWAQRDAPRVVFLRPDVELVRRRKFDRSFLKVGPGEAVQFLDLELRARVRRCEGRTGGQRTWSKRRSISYC